MKFELINRGKGIYGQGGESIDPEDLYLISTEGTATVVPTLQDVAQAGNVTTRPLVHAPATSNNESATLGQVLNLVQQGSFLRYDIDNQNLSQSQKNSALQNLGIFSKANSSWNLSLIGSQAIGQGSLVLGEGNIARSKNQVVLGEYAEDRPNLPDVYYEEEDAFLPSPGNYIFQIGTGIGPSDRRDSFSIRRDGYTTINSRVAHFDAIAPNESATLGQVQGLINNINITGVTDPRYIRRDINDNNGTNRLTLGNLTVNSEARFNGTQMIMQNLPMRNGSIIDILMVDLDKQVRRVPAEDLALAIANSAGTNQFSVGINEQLRFAGSGDASVSFNAATRTITISSTGGSSGEAGVITFNGRDGAVTSQTGDYTTTQVTEGTNQYFTQARVRSTPMSGLSTATPTLVTNSDSLIMAVGKLQAQVNQRVPTTRLIGLTGVSGLISVNGNSGTIQNQDLSSNRSWTIGLSPTSVTAGSYRTVTVDTYGRVTAGFNPTTLSGHGITDGVISSRTITAGNGLSGGGNLTANRTISLGTPSTLTVSTTNALTATSHTHNIDLSGRTLTAGNGLSGGGHLGADRAFSITDIAAGSTVVGALRYNGTTNSAGRMYGGTSNPSSTTRLNYAGNLWVTNLHATQDVIGFTSSDERLKDNLQTIEDALFKVKKLNGYSFEWNDKQETYTGKDYGIIAQQVKELFPEMVEERANGYLGVRYEKLIPVMIEAIKELSNKVEILERE